MAASDCEDIKGTWLNACRRPLIGYVLPLVNGDVQAAEDVVQETILRGWRHADELNPERAGSWLHVVARNIAISTYHRRRRTRPREVPLNEDTTAVADDNMNKRSIPGPSQLRLIRSVSSNES